MIVVIVIIREREQIDSNRIDSFLINFIYTIYECLFFGTYLFLKLIFIASKDSSKRYSKSLKKNHLLYEVGEEDEDVELYFNFYVHFLTAFILPFTRLSLFS
jgi:hypothetical protein